jgi:glycosyltransferase involved in cell wall biosynthesis
MNKPFVTILIDNYNYSRFLREAVDSALNQTYANTEVIVVDDGSTDDSRKIIAGYGDCIIPVMKDNGGQASAFNAGLEVSRGDWICFLDADDVWYPCKVQEVVCAVDEYPEAVLVYHKYQAVSEDLTPIDRVRPAGVFRGWIHEKVRRSGGVWTFPPTSALSLRKSALDRMGNIPENKFMICADGYIAYLAPFLGPVYGLDKCLTRYRIHDKNCYSGHSSRDGYVLDEYRREQVLRHRDLVASVNRYLEQAGIPYTLDLKDHWNYQALKYKLGDADRLSFSELAWRALVFSGDSAFFNRLRWAARFSLDAMINTELKGWK